MPSLSSTSGPDLSIEDARQLLAADVRRLNQVHVIEGWAILPNGTLHILCGCDHRGRDVEAFRQHILTALRAERGPIKKR